MEKLRTHPFPAQETIGKEEMTAAIAVMETGILSHFRGNYTKNFYGGPQVQALEEEFANYIGSNHAISINSCTSALQVACMAIGLKTGDEVIVTPWSMSCSASAPLICGAKPVFVDIEKDYFCISLDSIIAHTTKQTKAIIAVSLFGQSFDPRIREWADYNKIILIEDAAQAIGASVFFQGKPRKIGTLGHIGCFSFTQGKHITSGEGGMLVTDNKIFAQACRMYRNHYEAVANDIKQQQKEKENNFIEKVLLYNTRENKALPGYNLRMTEIQAAILREQLKKLDRFVINRQKNATRLDQIFQDYPDYFETPRIRGSSEHSFYAYALKFKKLQYSTNPGDPRTQFVQYLNELLPGEEGRPDKKMFNSGYITPLYEFPLLSNYKPFCKLPNVINLQEYAIIISTIVGLPLGNLDFILIKDAVKIALARVVEEFGDGHKNNK